MADRPCFWVWTARVAMSLGHSLLHRNFWRGTLASSRARFPTAKTEAGLAVASRARRFFPVRRRRMTDAPRVATMERMRFFNTEGPVRRDDHYCI